MIILAASLYALLSGKTQRIVLLGERSGEPLLTAEAPDGTEFSISYIHSVNKSPVTEYFRVEEGKIFLLAMRYESFGAGMPTEIDPDQSFSLEEGYMLITGYHRHMPELRLFISRTEGHVFEIGGKVTALSSLEKPGEAISIRVVR